jgi:hypothetical protein
MTFLSGVHCLFLPVGTLNSVQTRKAEGRQRVYVSAIFSKINAVDTVESRFGATLEVTYNWKITKEDLVELVAEVNRERWRPAFVPPPMQVINSAAGDGAAAVVTNYSRIYLIEIQHVKAITDHTSKENSNELSFAKGEIMTVTTYAPVGGRHHKGILAGAKGLIPTECVERYTASDNGTMFGFPRQMFAIEESYWIPHLVLQCNQYMYTCYPIACLSGPLSYHCRRKFRHHTE